MRRDTEEFHFQGTGGVRIVGDAQAPKDASQVKEIILFHHGLWVDNRTYPFVLPMLKSLSSENRIVFSYDARGHGRSCCDFATGEFGEFFDPEQMAPDLIMALNFIIAKFGLIDRKDLRVILIGHSLGGYVSVRAAAFDERISKVITLGAPLSFKFVKYDKLRIFLERTLVEIPQQLHDRSHDKRPMEVYRLKSRDLREAEKKLLALPPLADFADKIKCPVSFILGHQDEFAPMFDTRNLTAQLAKRIPGSKIILIPGEHAFFGTERNLIKTVTDELGPAK